MSISCKLFLLPLLLLLPAAVRAEPLPVGSFVDLSEAIVLGRLTVVDLQSSRTEENGTGYVTVEEVVAGPMEVGEKIPFEWRARFDTEIACPPGYRRESIQGVLGLWFLDRDGVGALRLNGEFWNLEEPQSLEYHADTVAGLERTERAALLLSLFERLGSGLP